MAQNPEILRLRKIRKMNKLKEKAKEHHENWSKFSRKYNTYRLGKRDKKILWEIVSDNIRERKLLELKSKGEPNAMNKDEQIEELNRIIVDLQAEITALKDKNERQSEALDKLMPLLAQNSDYFEANFLRDENGNIKEDV